VPPVITATFPCSFLVSVIGSRPLSALLSVVPKMGIAEHL
jgi:hypothetical protein